MPNSHPSNEITSDSYNFYMMDRCDIVDILQQLSTVESKAYYEVATLLATCSKTYSHRELDDMLLDAEFQILLNNMIDSGQCNFGISANGEFLIWSDNK